MAQVAERAHLDLSTLSRLESGKRRLALDHLPGLAAALGVRVDDLLVSVPVRNPRVDGPAEFGDGITRWPLTVRGLGGGAHAYRMVIAADSTTPPDALPTHEGMDWVYVVAGRLRLVLGDDEFVIAPGEAVEFSTWTPHWFGAIDGPVEIITIFGPQGERAHLAPHGSPVPPGR